MTAHKLICAGAALALLGTPVRAEDSPLFGALKLRSAVQMVPKEDDLRAYYLGAAYEVGYTFSNFGKLSAELGILYKPGIQEAQNLAFMEVAPGANPIDMSWSVDSHKNQLQGWTLRLAYDKPLTGLSVRGGLQFANLKFRQEYVGDITDARNNPTYRDNYNGIHDVGGLSISPFVGVTIPVKVHNFVEVNFMALNYKAVNYVHVAGTELGVSTVQNTHTSKDRTEENTRFIPHVEVAFGFRF